MRNRLKGGLAAPWLDLDNGEDVFGQIISKTEAVEGLADVGKLRLVCKKCVRRDADDVPPFESHPKKFFSNGYT
jgi:hypothetical protein